MSNQREGYAWWPQQGTRQMFICHVCGACVADTDQHDRFHQALLVDIAYLRKPPMPTDDL